MPGTSRTPVARFNAALKSSAAERWTERAIAEREDEVIAAALLIETDPDFARLRVISEEVDGLAAETAARHLTRG